MRNEYPTPIPHGYRPSLTRRFPSASALGITAILLGFTAALTPGIGHAKPAVADRAARSTAREITAAAQISFRGTSTLHDFDGRVASQPFTVKLSPDGESWSAAGDVEVAQMTTDNRKRDKNMFEMFKAGSFPTLHGEVTKAPVPAPGSSVTVPMALTISGITQTVNVSIYNWRQDAGGIAFKAAASISLSSYELKAPSVMGMIKVGNTITLEGDVRPVATASAAASQGN